MQSLSLLALQGLGLILLVHLILKTVFGRRRLPLPPGPKPLPIIGNLLDIPKVYPWKGYAELGRKYGDIFSLQVFGQVIVVVNSPTIAKELLEKRGAIYSDRPTLPFTTLMDNEWNLPVSPYGPRWRSKRRILEGSLRQSAISQHWSTQRARAQEFLAATLRAPDDFRAHIKYTIAAISLDVVYGYECTDTEDEFLSLSEKATQVASETTLPGAVIVNDYPFLRHLPGWLPGMGFHKLAKEARLLFRRARNVPFDHMKKMSSESSDVARPSVVSGFLNDKDASAEDEQLMKEAAGSVYGASVDTTSTVLIVLFLVLARYPEVQRKAQAELDGVIGLDRLPDFNDRPNLPYIQALCMELSRWRLAVPLGVAHCTTEDDLYNGYFIPKGSAVWANAWMMLHDPDAYPDPESFVPERFLAADGLVKQDPLCSSIFGFGRRICPGRHLADATIWIYVVSVLATLVVRPAKDGHGHDIPLDDIEFTPHVVSKPEHFECAISPRSQRAEELVAQSCAK